MDKAGQDYSLFTDEVLQLKLKINKTYDYVKGLPDNDETTAQWEIIKDPGRNSVAGFLEKWKAEGKLNPVFIKNAKRIITDHFNRVIELERGKRR